jgi:hypothetical protein
MQANYVPNIEFCFQWIIDGGFVDISLIAVNMLLIPFLKLN